MNDGLPSAFNQNIGNWNVSAVTDMFRMFNGAVAFNHDISNWDVSSVYDMYGMFWIASSFNKNLCAWGTITSSANVTNMFASSACPTQSNPNLNASPRGPFCHVCS